MWKGGVGKGRKEKQRKEHKISKRCELTKNWKQRKRLNIIIKSSSSRVGNERMTRKSVGYFPDVLQCPAVSMRRMSMEYTF